MAADLTALGPLNRSLSAHLEEDPEADPVGEEHRRAAHSFCPSEAARTGLEGPAVAVAVVAAERTAIGREHPSKVDPAAAASRERTGRMGRAHLEAVDQEECDLAWEEASGRAEWAAAHMG